MQLHCKQKGYLSTPFLLQCSSPCHAGNAHAVSTNSAARGSEFKTKATTLCFLLQKCFCAPLLFTILHGACLCHMLQHPYAVRTNSADKCSDV